jgi:hypothetical protein
MVLAGFGMLEEGFVCWWEERLSIGDGWGM